VEEPAKLVTKNDVKDISLPVIVQVTDDAIELGAVGLDIVQLGVVFVIDTDVGIWILTNDVVDKLFHVANENVSDVVPETILLSAVIDTFLSMLGCGLIA
jgi:hypothetical protein